MIVRGRDPRRRPSALSWSPVIASFASLTRPGCALSSRCGRCACCTFRRGSLVAGRIRSSAHLPDFTTYRYWLEEATALEEQLRFIESGS